MFLRDGGVSEVVGYFNHFLRGGHHHSKLLGTADGLIGVKKHIFLIFLIREEIKT